MNQITVSFQVLILTRDSETLLRVRRMPDILFQWLGRFIGKKIASHSTKGTIHLSVFGAEILFNHASLLSNIPT